MNKIKDTKVADINLLKWIFSHFDVDSANNDRAWPFKAYKMLRQVLFALQKLLFSNKELYYLKNLNYISMPQWHPEWRLLQHNPYWIQLGIACQL
jgi:hypothetical protein